MASLKTLCIVIFVLLAPVTIFAQITFPDTLFVKAAIESTKRIYDESTRNYSHLYNGKEYIEFKKNMPEVGTLFFNSPEWEEGEVFYDGELYENVSMRYDLLRDKLIVEHKGFSDIELINEKIKYFTIKGHSFVRLESKPDSKSAITTGFYDEIYDGATKVLVKRWKVTEEKVETQFSMTLTFKDKSAIFILKDGVYYPVGSKSSALKVFGEQKSALKKFMSHEQIKYRSNREAALIKIAREYDRLKE